MASQEILVNCCSDCFASLIKHIKTDGFTELCVSNLFKFEMSCHCEYFFFNLM